VFVDIEVQPIIGVEPSNHEYKKLPVPPVSAADNSTLCPVSITIGVGVLLGTVEIIGVPSA